MSELYRLKQRLSEQARYHNQILFAIERASHEATAEQIALCQSGAYPSVRTLAYYEAKIIADTHHAPTLVGLISKIILLTRFPYEF